MPRRQLEAILGRIERVAGTTHHRRERRWSRSLRHRVLLACVALRTNLTFRELAACASIPPSTAHRIVAALTPMLASLLPSPPRDRRLSWIVDGTLIPTRDHRCATKSKNCRSSCNAQILIQQRDLRIVATSAGGPGHRNDRVHYRESPIAALCRAHERGLADGGLPRLSRAHHTGVSRQLDRSQRGLASPSLSQGARRARHRQTQELARPP